MPDLNYYDTGTCTVVGDLVTGDGVDWTVAKPGDRLFVNGLSERIAVGGNDTLQLVRANPGMEQVDGPYEIQFAPRSTGYSNRVVELIEAVSSGNLPAFAMLNGTGGDKGVMLVGENLASTYPLTDYGRELAGVADEVAALDALGFSAFMQSLRDDADAPAVLAALGYSSFMAGLRTAIDGPAVRSAIAAAPIATPIFTGGTAKVQGSTPSLTLVDAALANMMSLSVDGAAAYLWSFLNLPLQIATNNIARLIIDGAGRRTAPYQPRATLKGYPTAFTTAAAKVWFDTPLVNIGAHWSYGNNNFTCPVAAPYKINFHTYFLNASASGDMDIRVRKNGTQQTATYETRHVAAPVQYTNIAMSATIDCVVNDVLDIYLGSGYVAPGTATFCTIEMLG